ncbi:hypothetical protein ACIQWL_49430 [Streptomyces mirabilis]|uniref:hypothetical protein n=1 Tax=Streptomyces mirabilis TaxID=68239 RepID=UPI0038084189
MLAAAQWHEAKDNPGLWLKARIALTLSERDAVRAQRYEDALRDVTLHLELEQERRRQFRAAVLVDPDAARIWWLERHLDDVSSLDWGVFREKVLPLVGAADDMQSRAERMARTFLYVWEKLGNDPGQHARFAATAKTVLEQMGWADAAPWLLSSEPVATVDPSGTSSDDAGKRRLTTEASAGR